MKTLLKTLLVFFLFITSFSCKKDSNSSIASIDQSSNDQMEIDSTVVDTSLLCYLPFTGNFKDKSGHNNNGILKGTISYVADRFGNASHAVSFSASNSWIEIPESSFVGMPIGTISLDFYPAPYSQQQLVSKMSYSEPIGSPGFYQSFTILLQSDGVVAFDLRKSGYCNASDGSGWNPTIYSNTGVINYSWNHLAITFSNTTQKMYLNGNLVATSVISSSPICQGEPIRLGVWWQSDPEYFTGNMDEVRIYKRVLTAAQIKKLSVR